MNSQWEKWFGGKKVLDQQSTPTDSYTLQADLRKSWFIESQKGMQNVRYRYIINQSSLPSGSYILLTDLRKLWIGLVNTENVCE